MRKWITVFLLIPQFVFAQTDGDYQTRQVAGNWTTVTKWQVFTGGAWQNLETAGAGIYQNVIPSSASGTITVQHNTTIASDVAADQLVISLTTVTLTISPGFTLTIDDGPGVDLANGGVITTSGALVISNNAVYEHTRNGGTIPLATWGTNSTCLVTGITTTQPTLIAANAYYNFIWDCIGQTNTRTLGSNLRTVNGNLEIRESNNQLVQFATGTAYTLDVANDFLITDNSRVQFCTNATGVIINVGGNFNFAPTTATTSTLKASGSYTLNISGGFEQSGGLLTLSSAANAGTINLAGDFTQSAGTITETGAGSGLFNFNGSAGVQNVTQTGTISNSINATIQNTNGIVLNSDVTLPSNLSQLAGAGNIDLNGFTLTINGNLSQASGSIACNTTSGLILQGTGVLPGAISFAGTDLATLDINQTGTLSTSSAISITNLFLRQGAFTTSSISMATGGTITRIGGTISNTPGGTSYNVVYANTAAIATGPELPTLATVLNNLSKSAAGTLTLSQSITINGDLSLTGGTFAAGANSISLAGNFTSNATMTSATGGTFTVTGNCALSGTIAPTFDALIVNGTLTPSVGYRVNGNYDVGIGAIVNAGSGIVTFGGTSVVTNNGTMNLNAVTILTGTTMTAPATTMGIAGNFTSTGTFNNGGGTILFNGTTNLTATEVYNNVTVSGTVTSTGNFAQTIGGNLINNGSFSIGTGNLTWSGSGTISGTGNITVGDVIVTGPSCTYTASGNLTLNDDLLGAGSFDSSTSPGTVIFAGAGSAINRTGTTTFRSISVTGTLTPATTYTLTGVGGIDVSGTLASGGTVIFGGTTQTITGSSLAIAFNTFTTNTGSSLTITPDITINGNLTGNGDIVSAGTITFVGLTMSGTGVKDFNNVVVGTGTLNPNANYSISGNLVVNGTLAAGTGTATTTFDGTTTISGAGGITFNFLTITGSLTSSPGTILVVRDFTNNGTFNHNNGTVQFSTAGTVQQQILGTSSTIFNNLVVSNANVATDLVNNVPAPQTVSIVGAITFSEINAVFDADGAGTSELILLSTNDSPAQDARIGTITTGSNVTGNFTVQRYVSNEASGRFWRYISSPVVGATVAQLQNAIPVTGTFTDPSTCVDCISTNPSLYFWNETTGAYVAYPSSGSASAATFANGRGYSAFFRHTGAGGVGNVTINFRGTNPSVTTVSLPVSPNASGYSLVGNPYPSAIVWNNGAGWSKTNIADGIVVRDNATGVHQAYSAAAGTGIIAAGQSFWVQSTAAGASLSINENAKSAVSTSFYRMGQPMADELSIMLTKANTGTTDRSTIGIRSGSSLSTDSFDVPKFNNNVDDGTSITEVHDIAVMNGTSMLMVNAIPELSCSQTFNLRINDILNSGETTASYSLDIQPSGSFASMNWILVDAQTGQEHNLSNGAYTFTASISDPTVQTFQSGTRYRTNRFSLKFVPSTINVNTAISAVEKICNGSEMAIQIADSQKGMTYGVEINGQLYPSLVQGNGSSVPVFIDSDRLASGVNTIRVFANSGCDSQFLSSSLSVQKVDMFEIVESAGAALCSAGSATLTARASSSEASIRWYVSESSSEVIGTSENFVSPILYEGATYYAAAVNQSGCESARVPVLVEFVNLSSSIEIEKSAPSVCIGETMTLTASSENGNGTYLWFESPISSQPLSESASISTTVYKNKNYYVAFRSVTGCVSDRVVVTANVNSYNPELQVQTSVSSVCPGGSHNLFVQGAEAGATYYWYESADSKTPLFMGERWSTPKLDASVNYYVAAISADGCSSNRRFEVKANVELAPVANYITTIPDLVCPETEVNLALTPLNVTNKTYRWYDSKEALTPEFEGLEFRTSSLDGKTSYFVSAVSSLGCESLDRKELTINTISMTEPVINNSAPGILTSNYTVGNQWYFNDEPLVGETGQELVIGDKIGTYALEVTKQGCSQRATRWADMNIVTSVEGEEKVYDIYPNPAHELVNIRVQEELPVEAQLLDAKGTVLETIRLKSVDAMWEGVFDVSQRPSGSYFMKLNSGKKSVTHQVVIKR